VNGFSSLLDSLPRRKCQAMKFNTNQTTRATHPPIGVSVLIKGLVRTAVVTHTGNWEMQTTLTLHEELSLGA
jgi:hypothetical protein